MIAAILLAVVLAPPEAPAPAPTELSPGTAAPAEPEVQRPAGVAAPEVAPGVTPAPVTTPSVTPAPVAAPVTTPTPRARVQRPRPGEGDVVAPAGPRPASDGQARYYRAPFAETVWPKVVGREVLLVLGERGRTCVTLTRKTSDALHYIHRKSGAAQQAPLAAVTSIHENSWECDKDYDSTPAEWARSGAIGGLVLSSVGALMGVLHDVDTQTCVSDDMGGLTCSKKLVPHFAYSVVGVTTTTLGTPIIAAGGYSTSRDLRVKGKIWAKATGWALYGSGTLLNVLWLVGNYGKVDALDGQGMTAAAGLLGLGGSAFMALDALAARKELAELRREDATPVAAGKPTARLQFGARPLGAHGQMHGLTFGLGGRF